MADGSTIAVRANTRKKLIADLWCGAGGGSDREALQGTEDPAGGLFA